MDFKPKPVHMFNSYTKLTTAFAAFALLFSTGIWSQCDPAAVSVGFDFNLGGTWAEESYTLNNSDGVSVHSNLNPIASESLVLTLPEGEYNLIGSDDYGDGWDSGATFITLTINGVSTQYTVDAQAVPGGTSISQEWVITIGCAVPGCMDSTACNYASTATEDDGSCCFNDCITILLLDQWSDGWSYGGVAGGFDFAGTFYEFDTGGIRTLEFCLPAGCYSGTITIDQYVSEGSWEVYQNGALLTSGTALGSLEVFFSTDPSCIVAGCTDELACNYDETANVNNGSCEYTSCAGCMDPTACNYDDTATFNDGCDYSCIGCMDATAANYDPAATMACADCCIACSFSLVTLNMYDSYGDGWNANTLDIDGVIYCMPDALGDCSSTSVYTQWSNGISFTLCMDLSVCHVVTYNPTGSWQSENSWDIVDADGITILASAGGTAGACSATDGAVCSGTFGTCTSGCTDAGACNYVGPFDIDDGSCDFSCVGCMDSSAANFDPNATIDSGLCVFCDPGTFVLTVNMFDSFGDGWNGAVYYVYDQVSGALMLTGDLDNAFSGDGLNIGADLVCLAPGCYTITVSSGSYPSEISLSMSDQFGTNYGTIGVQDAYPIDFTLTGACEFEGCTSPTAINYNISASIDDGSCEEPPANDQLANAEAVACGAFATGSLLFATDASNLIGTEFGNNAVSDAGVWYSFNAAAEEQVTFSTCDTPSNDGTTDYVGNTQLFAFTQALDGSLVPIVSNNDECDLLSTVTINTSIGVDYFVHVSNYLGSAGNDFVLSVTCATCGLAPSNDDCDGAIAQVDGVPFIGTTCCASAEGDYMSQVAGGTAYGVWFTFNSSNYDTFDFYCGNASADATTAYGLYIFNGDGTCESIIAAAGCAGWTGACAGSVESFLTLEPNTDYYFCVFAVNDATDCGEFEFTTNGVIFGCTDSVATNYNPDATHDDGSCDFTGIVPANDLCDNAIDLVCNTVTTGSTGGSTILGSPIGVTGCETAPGAGVWYSFVGDGQLNSLSTCGSDIDSKINIYTATTECGGGGIDVPPADPCGAGLVTVHYSVTPDAYPGEMGFSITENATGTVWASAVYGDVTAGGLTGSVCLPEGDYTVTLMDSWGDGWVWSGTGSLALSNDLGESIGYWSMADPGGASGAGLIETVSLTVSPYSMEPTYQAGDFTCFASATSSDGVTSICDLFDADDVGFEFVSTVGTLYYILVGSDGTDGTFDLTFDCATTVYGCMNPTACNFDLDANIDDNTCDLWSCVCATETGIPVQFTMIDNYGIYGEAYEGMGDGWEGAVYEITDLNGALVHTGSLDDAGYQQDNDNYTGPEYGFDMLCLEPGCYIVTVGGGATDAEIEWSVEFEDGTVVAAGGAPTSVTISLGGAVCGCTDSTACNYDEFASDEDGSCEYLTCAGCMDSTACNYDALATIESGTCCSDNCVEVEMFDSYGDGWIGSYTLSSVDGTVIGTGTIDTGEAATDSYCLPDGCYTIDVVCNETTWCYEMSWNVLGAFGGLVSGGADESMTFNVGSGDQCVVGCDITCACNYNAATNIQDLTQCVFSGCEGCTYPDATNYDVLAITDDGLCEFEIANPCPADLNGDGSVTALDLLEFLAAFGTVC